MTRKLVESGTFVEGTKSDKGTLVRIIREGQGSSGYYSRELLESHATAFSNALSFVNHPKDATKPWERTFLDIAGEIKGDTWYEEREGVGAIYGYYHPDDKYAKDIEKYASKIGLSIFIEGEGSESEDGRYIVESLNADDAYRSVDVVIAAGAGGRFERAMESFRVREGADSAKPSATSAQGKEKEIMEEKLDALIALMTTFVSESKAKAEKDTQVEADAETIEKAQVAAVEAYDAEIAKIEAEREHLLPSQIESLRAEAKAGKDVTTSLDIAKKIVTEARTTLTESVASGNGRFVESKTSDPYVGRWS